MIITVTPNPMVEHLFPVPGLRPGGAFRPEGGRTIATGRGLNVARALRDLGEKVVAVLPVGGRRGREIEELVEREGIPAHFLPVRGESRVGFTAYDAGVVTTVYGPISPLSDGDVETLVADVSRLLPARALVLAGHVSHPDLFPRLVALGVPVVLDFAQPSFHRCMKSGSVLLAKPNRRECLDLFAEDDPVAAAAALHAAGARWSVVTDGSAPAIVQNGSRVWRVTPPAVTAVHAVGSGDALCAGLLHARGRGPERAVAFAMACGAYNASRPEVANLDPAACEALADQVVLEPLSAWGGA